ncbi:MAG: hypothetical protein ISS26_07855, partial [Candidatus Omnitrophica bacterium]|nr:hypothetical protein [Candidatus Omnitrophota bacterium]
DEEWILGIELPEDSEVLRVMQNDKMLDRVDDDTARYCLNNPKGAITITGDPKKEDGLVYELTKDYLIFKMHKDWKCPGRLVKNPTMGYYLVVVPEEWERDEERSGIAPIEPEGVKLEGYKAHYFYVQEDNEAIVFIMSGGEQIVLDFGRHGFRLVGKEIVADVFEERGQLFGERPPFLQILDERRWNEIGTIVIGEEGPGRHKWRTQFSPKENIKRQRLPRELYERCGGWYFIRIYDTDGMLLESMDFRFLNGLKDIESPHYPFPDPQGHKPVNLIFHHMVGCKVTFKPQEPQSDSLSIERNTEKTIALIPSEPEWDELTWIVSTDKKSITIIIRIDRIRWSLVERGAVDNIGEQMDRPLRAERNWFSPDLNKEIRIWFPKPGWTQEILVGFSKFRSTSIPVRIDSPFATVLLKEFYDINEIQDLEQCLELKFWVALNSDYEGGAAICTISPQCVEAEEDAPPEILSETEDTDIPFEVEEIDPFSIKSCSTCDHARVRNDIYWCRHYRWPHITRWIFKKQYSRFICSTPPRWEGEDEYDYNDNKIKVPHQS